MSSVNVISKKNDYQKSAQEAQEPSLDKSCFIFPRIARYSRLGKSIFEKFGCKVFYRDSYDKELIQQYPSDIYCKSNGQMGGLLDTVVSEELANTIAKKFSINSEYLMRMGRELLFKRIENDFYYSYFVWHRCQFAKKQLVIPLPKRIRKIFYSYLGGSLENESVLIRLLCRCALIFEHSKLAFETLIKTTYAIVKLVYWRFSKESSWAKRVKDNIIWVPGGVSEVSLDVEKLSLPNYLKELLGGGRLGEKKFAVTCPFLNKEDFWDEPGSFAIPQLRSLNPELKERPYKEELVNLLKLLVYVPGTFFQGIDRLELLSLLPFFFLDRVCLRNIQPSLVVVTDSIAGSAYSMTHAAREEGIPVVMVSYSGDTCSSIVDKANGNVILPEFLNMIAEYFCVWNQRMKIKLHLAGYPLDKIHIVGSQMFASLDILKGRSVKKSKRIKIGIFSSTPFKDEWLLGLGRGEHFWNKNYYFSFMKLAFETIQQVFHENFVILTKNKRSVESAASNKLSGWAEEVRSMIGIPDDHFDSRDPDMNPWAILDESDIVLSAPFSSMSEGGLAMGKLSAYFDPLGLLQLRPEDPAPLISGREQLYQWLCDAKVKLQTCNNGQDYSQLGPVRVGEVFEEILSDNSKFQKRKSCLVGR